MRLANIWRKKGSIKSDLPVLKELANGLSSNP